MVAYSYRPGANGKEKAGRKTSPPWIDHRQFSPTERCGPCTGFLEQLRSDLAHDHHVILVHVSLENVNIYIVTADFMKLILP